MSRSEMKPSSLTSILRSKLRFIGPRIVAAPFLKFARLSRVEAQLVDDAEYGREYFRLLLRRSGAAQTAFASAFSISHNALALAGAHPLIQRVRRAPRPRPPALSLRITIAAVGAVLPSNSDP